jgi:oligopeptide transport system permease protein
MTDTTNKPPTEAVLAPDVATPEVVPAQAPQQGKPTSLWSDAWKELRRKPSFVISAVIIIIMMTMAIVPQLFTSADPRDCNLLDALQPPSAEHWFGFDLQGCDYYARTIYGLATRSPSGWWSPSSRHSSQ